MSSEPSLIVRAVLSASGVWRAGIRFGGIIESYGGVPTRANEDLKQAQRTAEEQGIT